MEEYEIQSSESDRLQYEESSEEMPNYYQFLEKR